MRMLRGVVSIALVLALVTTGAEVRTARPDGAADERSFQEPPRAIRPDFPPSSQPFDEFLADLRKEALARGISAATVERALDGIEPLPVVLERDRTQAERTLSLEEYLARRLKLPTIRTAREMAHRHATLLRRVSAAYGVPGSVIVAIWGLESNFGRFSGVRPTIPALTTLAYDQRRAAFFRDQLFHALAILDHGDIALERMKGSWAGAMGQPQFMPSSYVAWAQDFDEDGRRDIWESEADVFASIANYLKGHGWAAGSRWGREVRVAPNATGRVAAAVPLRTVGCEAERQMTESRPLSRWSELGVALPGGQPLPRGSLDASLVRGNRRTFLVYESYQALLEYNCAHSYALSVALLAERVGLPP